MDDISRNPRIAPMLINIRIIIKQKDTKSILFSISRNQLVADHRSFFPDSGRIEIYFPRMRLRDEG